MTKLERAALAMMIRCLRRPSITSSQWTPGEKRIELVGPKEVDRLFASEDFLRGWEECHRRTMELLQFLTCAKPREVKDWLDREKRELDRK